MSNRLAYGNCYVFCNITLENALLGEFTCNVVLHDFRENTVLTDSSGKEERKKYLQSTRHIKCTISKHSPTHNRQVKTKNIDVLKLSAIQFCIYYTD